jgi:hypothetical protein
MNENQIHCQQCSAVLPVEQGSQFVTCQYCGTTNFVDKSRAVLHYLVRSTVQEETALTALRRWMAGNATVKDLDRKAQIERPTFEYFPMWLVRVKQKGVERVFLEPAAALSVTELKQLTLPAADLELYDPMLDNAAISPTVPYEAMQQWLTDDHQVQTEDIREVSLVHLPVYMCKYNFKDRRYTAVVDAATSKVFANIYPSKWEAPYAAIGAATFLLYFCAALTPIGGYMVDEGAGLAIGIMVYVVAAIVLALPIFALAAFISAKV